MREILAEFTMLAKLWDDWADLYGYLSAGDWKLSLEGKVEFWPTHEIALAVSEIARNQKLKELSDCRLRLAALGVALSNNLWREIVTLHGSVQP